MTVLGTDLTGLLTAAPTIFQENYEKLNVYFHIITSNIHSAFRSHI
jgi:hypothetical protein